MSFSKAILKVINGSKEKSSHTERKSSPRPVPKYFQLQSQIKGTHPIIYHTNKREAEAGTLRKLNEAAFGDNSFSVKITENWL